MQTNDEGRTVDLTLKFTPLNYDINKILRNYDNNQDVETNNIRMNKNNSTWNIETDIFNM